MKTIYLDADYLCHVNPGIGRIAYNTTLFDSKCDAYIEGYRLIPEGARWIRADGVRFTGLMITPAVKYDSLVPWQTQYEIDKSNMMELDDIAELVELIYQDDLGVIG